MKWVQEFVNLDGLDLDKLINQFSLSTAEVESISHKGRNTSGVVAAKILSVKNHPNSKKLHLLQVDTGTEVVPCVCGAPNVKEGMIVAFATVSSSVNGASIGRANLAGYESCGMCCSEAELGISGESSGIAELNFKGELGTDIKRIIDMDDVVFEVDNKSLTNRPDLWGIHGIAREFCAITNRKLKEVDVVDCSAYTTLPKINIELLTPEVYRYSAISLDNITKNDTPLDMKIRLFYCGVRSINLIADLTNYVMLEIGQPMHAFDASKIQTLQVKHYNDPFVFKTLDGINRNINKDVMMICSEDKPVAIAGIMGGLDSGIRHDTSSVVLESATFDAVTIRKASSFLSCRTDASARFEKSLDTNMTTKAIGRFLKLVRDLDPGASITSALSDVCTKMHKPLNIKFSKKYLTKYMGIETSDDVIFRILKSLGFEIKNKNENDFEVLVPTFRATKDVSIKADIVEEITRIYGYDNINPCAPTASLLPVELNTKKSLNRTIKDILVRRYNLHEVHSYIWCDEARFKEIGIKLAPGLKILNSVNPNLTTLRSSMIPTLLSFIGENKTFSDAFGIFEIGSVLVLDENNNYEERKKLGIVMLDKINSCEKLFFKLRDIVFDLVHISKNRKTLFRHTDSNYLWQHPNNTVALNVCSKDIGFISVLNPAVLQHIDKKSSIVFAELDINLISSIKKQNLSWEEPSKFPDIKVDLSFVLDKTKTYDNILEPIKSLNLENLDTVELIDIFEIDDKTSSLTVRLDFVSKERTLFYEEVQDLVDKITEILASKGIFLKGI
ncbi:MAG: phenylalanine--tRNA ligase subunit beta [Oscillospiraceae bacterium]|jgi:phenylalanyl-tRNA synthetase beta chain|nr:phenylalanine--tRNA ligase subunit beta [Oscillospiraceae bacterium]